MSGWLTRAVMGMRHPRVALVSVCVAAVALQGCGAAGSADGSDHGAVPVPPIAGDWSAPGGIVIRITPDDTAYQGTVVDAGAAAEVLDVGTVVLRLRHAEGNRYDGEYLRVASEGYQNWMPCTLTLTDAETLRASYGVTYVKRGSAR